MYVLEKKEKGCTIVMIVSVKFLASKLDLLPSADYTSKDSPHAQHMVVVISRVSVYRHTQIQHIRARARTHIAQNNNKDKE